MDSSLLLVVKQPHLYNHIKYSTFPIQHQHKFLQRGHFFLKSPSFLTLKTNHLYQTMDCKIRTFIHILSLEKGVKIITATILSTSFLA